jgi:YVTN family beta-propeller protein
MTSAFRWGEHFDDICECLSNSLWEDTGDPPLPACCRGSPLCLRILTRRNVEAHFRPHEHDLRTRDLRSQLTLPNWSGEGLGLRGKWRRTRGGTLTAGSRDLSQHSQGGTMKKTLFLVVFYTCLFCSLVSAQQYVSLPENSGPMASDVDPDTNVAVVANRNANTVSIIDLSSNTIKTTIAVGTTPTSVAINSRTHQAIVTNFGSDDISVIDLETEEVVDTIPVGNSPRDVAIDPEHNMAIVANLNDNSVSLIDLNTGGDLLPTPIPVGTFPISVGYNPVNHTALVVNYQDGTVSVIDLEKKMRVGEILVGSNPVDIAVSFELNRAVVANQASGSVSIIQLTDLKVLTTITVGNRPFGIAINPKTKLAAALSNGDQTISLIYLGDGFYDDIIHDTNEVDHRNTKLPGVIPGAGDNPVHLSINPNTNTALSCNLSNNRVSLLSLDFQSSIPFVLDTGDFRADLLLSSLGWAEANVRMELRNKDGEFLGAGIARVPANGFKQINQVSRVLQGASTITNTQGLLRLTSDQPFACLLNLTDNNSGDFSMLTGRSTGHAKWLFPFLPNSSGLQNRLAVWNTSDLGTIFTLTLRNGLGAVLATKESASIPAKGFYTSDNIFSDLPSNAQGGALEISSPALSHIIPIVLLQDNKRVGSFVEAVPQE